MPETVLPQEQQQPKKEDKELQQGSTDAVIPEQVKPLLEDMPEAQRKAVEAIVVAMSVKMHKGPLPAPDTLREYEQILPGCADRIVSIFEEQAKHRMNMEAKVIPEDQRQSSKGQNMGFVLAISFMMIAGILVWFGHDTAGTILGTIDLVALVSIFVLGKVYQKRTDEIENT